MRGPLAAYQRSGLQRLVRRSGVLARLSPTLATMDAVAPELGRRTRLPERVAARGTRRAVVGMLTGCVQREFFPEVNAATARVLAMEGCDVVIPAAQGCCGALSVHNGRAAEARGFARALVDAFSAAEVDRVVVNSAGCGSSMKEYAELLADDPAYAERAAAFAGRVRDVTEVLVELGPVAERHPLDLSVAYHDACHLQHAQGVRVEPREVLKAIPGLEVLEVPEAAICCGSAGIYNIVEPEAARELGERKVRNVLETNPQAVVSSNPGCLLQIASGLERAGRPLPTLHMVEILDASIRKIEPEALLQRR